MTQDEGHTIDGIVWHEAIVPCGCGRAPTVWRMYSKAKPEYAVRCAHCRVELHDRSRRRCILRWNECMENGGENKFGYGWRDIKNATRTDGFASLQDLDDDNNPIWLFGEGEECHVNRAHPATITVEVRDDGEED